MRTSTLRLRNLFVTIFVTASVCAIAPGSRAQEAPPNCRPLWTAKLVQRPLGKSKQLSTFLRPESTFEFFDDDHLMLSEIDSRAGSSRSEVTSFASYLRVAYFFDADTGKLAFSKEWETHAHDSFIYVTNSGLLLRTGSEIRLYSREFQPVQQLQLSSLDPHERWFISISPSRRTILLNHYDSKQSHLEVRDGSTLDLIQAWTEPAALQPHLYTISDSAIATTDSGQKEIFVSDFGSARWRNLYRGAAAGCLSTPSFLSAKFLVSRVCQALTVFSTEGETHMSIQPEKDESVEAEMIATTRNGRAFAISYVKGKGGGFFDTDVRRTRNRIVVYDLSSKKQLLTVSLVPSPQKQYNFAFSPDGTKLAILNDRSISVCSVPY